MRERRNAFWMHSQNGSDSLRSTTSGPSFAAGTVPWLIHQRASKKLPGGAHLQDCDQILGKGSRLFRVRYVA
jgi:hypothetical protein